jgi:hypothetical protein
MDAAVASLRHLGIGPDRLVLESAGPGWAPGVVARQDPAAGAPLTAQTRVVLAVGGAGALDTLPFPLRDAHEDELRADRVLALADNPLLKLGLFIRRAGGFLALDPDDPVTASRWIEDVFQLSAAPWPRARWYSVARLLPALHRVAGRPDAVPLALRVLFDLPVASTRVVPARVERNGDDTRLSGDNARLGVDTVLGGAPAEASVEIHIGPVPFAAYLEHTKPAQRAQRDALYRLILPIHLPHVEEIWTVGDPGAAPRLGQAADPPTLGVNSYLG